MHDEPINIFGFGRDGLPGEINVVLSRDGEAERIAAEIINRWQEWAKQRNHRGRRRLADSQLPELATLAYCLVAHYRRERTSPPAIVLDALAYVLGLISPKTGRPIPTLSVLGRFGLPTGVRDVEAFMEAAKLDGEADASGQRLSVNGLAKQLNVTRATARKWRAHPDYIRRRHAVAKLAKIAKQAYAKE